MQETQETLVQSLGQEDTLEKEMANHSSSLGCKIPWTEEPGRLQSMGSQRVGHDWACMHTHTFIQKLINFCEIKYLVHFPAFLESKKHIIFLVLPLPRLWLWGTFINSEFQFFFFFFSFSISFCVEITPMFWVPQISSRPSFKSSSWIPILNCYLLPPAGIWWQYLSILQRGGGRCAH